MLNKKTPKEKAERKKVIKEKVKADVEFKLKKLNKRLIPIMLLLAALPAILVSLLSIVVEQRLVNQKVNELTTQISNEKAAYVDSFIGSIQNELDIALKNPEVLNKNQAITLSALKAVQEADSNLMYVYVGTQDKNMTIYPASDLGQGYDPTTRPWYQDAISYFGKFVATDPYKDAATGKVVVTVAKAVKDTGGKNIVIAADIDLSVLIDKVMLTKVGTKGYPLLLLADGTIIAHPKPEMLMVNIAQKYDWGKEIVEKKNGSINYTLDEKNIAGYKQSEKTGWILMATIPSSDYASSLKKSIMQSIWIVLGIILLSIITGILVTRYISNPLINLTKLMKRAEDGDYTITIDTKRFDEIGQIERSFNNLMVSNREIIKGLIDLSNRLGTASKDMKGVSESTIYATKTISNSIEGIAASTETNAASIEEANAGVEEMASNAQTVSMAIEKVRDNSSKSVEIANEGYSSVDNAASSMEKIKGSAEYINNVVNELYDASKEIDTIVKTITAIASQTNLLALNAAIEAARAGESGRGFAVVADEVRKLAEESSNAAKNIESLISDIQIKVSNTVDNVRDEILLVEEGSQNAVQAKEALKEISKSIKGLETLIEEVSAAAQEQSASAEEMSAVISNINQSIEETVTRTEEVLNTTHEQNSIISSLENSANELEVLVDQISTGMSRFKI